jgi:hypothetical protein
VILEVVDGETCSLVQVRFLRVPQRGLVANLKEMRELLSSDAKFFLTTVKLGYNKLRS